MNTIEYLKEVYGYDTPIILKNIRIGGKSKTAIRQELSRAYKNNLISKSGNGIYCFPSPVRVLPFNGLNEMKIIEAKYLKEGFVIENFDINRIGYYSGFTLLNMMKISPQVPAFYEVTTNKATSNKRTVLINGIRVILRKPKTEINHINWKTLQFLDLMTIISEEDLKNKEKLEFLKTYIRNNLRKFDLEKYLNLYSTKTIKKVVESGLIYEFQWIK